MSSKTIDEKVVAMKFNNSDFEKNAKQSLSTLEKLKEKLSFKGAEKGFENISSASKKVDVSSIGKAADAVSVKFSALQVVATTALANITNSAVNAGKQLVSAFTIDPVKDGFSEYQLKMNSIRTMLNSSGESLQTINKYLNDLNVYSDRTIYSFADMTENIGKFTNAGVSLDKAVAAIKGISNEAAVSGANANEASRAMYNFAQALSAGYVKLIDWKSIENANMATVEFKQQLIDTAVAIGTVTKSADGMYTTLKGNAFNATKNFNDVLQDQWMTTDVLVKTLNNYADETTEIGKKAYKAATEVTTFTQLMDTLKESVGSGWAETWQLIIGDYDQAKEVFTWMSNFFGDIIQKASDARNSLLAAAVGGPVEKWSELSNQIQSTGLDVEKFKNELIETAKSHNINVDEMIQKYGSFEKSLNHWLNKDLIVETLKRMSGGTKEAAESQEQLNEKLTKFQDVVNKVWNGDFKNGTDRYKALADAGYDYSKVQDLVNKTVEGHKLTLEDLGETQLKAVGYTDEEVKSILELKKAAETTNTPLNQLIESFSQKQSGRELLFDSLKNTLTAVSKVLGAIKGAWDDVFTGITGQGLYGAIQALNDFSKWLIISDTSAENLRATLRGVFSILHIVTTIMGGGFKIALKLVSTIMGNLNLDFLTVTGAIGNAVYKVEQFIFKNNLLIDILTKVAGAMGNFIGGVYKLADSIFHSEKAAEAVEVVSKRFEGLKSSVDKYLCGVAPIVDDLKKSIQELDLSKVTFEDIKKIIKDFSDNVTKYFKKMGNPIDFAKDSMKTFAGVASDSMGKASGAIDKAKDVIDKFKETVKTAYDFIKEKLSNVNLGSIVTIAISGSLVKSLLSVSKLFEALTGIAENFAGIGKAATGILNSISGAMAGFAKNMKAEAILKLAKALAVLVGCVATLTLLDQDKMWSAVGALTAIGGGLVALSIAIGKTGDLKDFGKMATILLSISTAVLMISVAVKKLDGIGWNSVMKGLAVIGTFFVGMYTTMKALSGNSIIFDKSSVAILAMAVSIRVLVGAVKKISDMDPKKAATGLIYVSILILELKSLSGVLSYNGFASSVSAAGTLIALAVSLRILVNVIKKIADMEPQSLIKGIIGLTTLVGLCGHIMILAGNAGEHTQKAGLAIAGISAGMLIMVRAVKIISRMSVGDIVKGTATLTAMSVMIGSLIAVSKKAGPNAAKAGAMLMGVGTAMLLLSASMLVLSLIKWPDLAVATASIGALGLMFAALIKATENSKDATKLVTQLTIAIAVLSVSIAALAMIDKGQVVSASASIAAVMGSMALLIASTEKAKMRKNTLGTLLILVSIVSLLALIIKQLAEVKAGLALQSALGISALLFTMSGCIELLSLTNGPSTRAMVSLAAMVAIMAGLSGVIGTMNGLGVEGSIHTATALSELLIVMTGCIAVLSKVQKVSGSAMLGMATMTLVLGGVAGVLGIMQNFKIGVSIETATSLSILLVALSGCCVILSAVGPVAGQALAGIGVLAALIAGIGTLMAAIGGLCDLVPSLKTFITEAIPVLEAIGQGIGSFIGGIIGGVIGGALDFLPKFGQQLADFSINAAPFFTTMSSVDSSVITGVESLAKAIYTLTKADILDGITSWITGGVDFKSFGENAGLMGEAVSKFAEKVKGLDGSGIENGAKACKTLAEVFNEIPATGGWIEWATGKKDIPSFTENITNFADAIIAFSNKISQNGGVNADITSAAKAGKDLATMFSEIPTEGGWLENWTGKQNFAKFNENISAFADAIISFSNKVSGGIDTSGINSAVEAGKAIVNMANELPTTGGIVSWFLGDNDLGDFAINIEDFGNGIKNFATAVAGITVDGVSGALDVGRELIKMANDLPEGFSLLKGIFVGDDTLSGFSTNIQEFGKGLANFATSVSDISYDSIEPAIKAGKALIKMSNEIGDNGGTQGVKGFFCGDDSLGGFSSNVKTFGESISDFADAVKDVTLETVTPGVEAGKGIIKMLNSIGKNTENVQAQVLKEAMVVTGEGIQTFSNDVSNVDTENIKKVIKSLQDTVTIINSTASVDTSGIDKMTASLKSISQTSVDTIVNTLNGGQAQVASAMKGLVSSMVTSASASTGKFSTIFDGPLNASMNNIKGKASGFTAAGITLSKALQNGCITPGAIISINFTSALDYTIRAINGYHSSFYNSGAYAVTGFANGITANTFRAKAAATAMAQAALNAANKTLKIQSPSRKFYKSGFYTVAGFVKGIKNNITDVYSAGKDIAVQVLDGVHSTLDGISSVFDDNNFTVSPTLDLSGVRSSVNDLNSIIDSDRTLAMAATLNTKSEMSMTEMFNSAIDRAVERLAAIEEAKPTPVYEIHSEVELDGRKVAKGIATYTQDELDKLDRRNSRKRGDV